MVIEKYWLSFKEIGITRMFGFKIHSRCTETQFGIILNGPTKENESSSLSGQPIFTLYS